MEKRNYPIKIATDCSGIGAPEMALETLGINHRVIFACDIDKYARQSYRVNHKCENMYTDMTKRKHHEQEHIDIYCAGIPCQSFSLAGKRLGEQDDRGVLFYTSHEFIRVAKPRYFIIENVKGLLSIENGRVFSNWLSLLATTVNGQYNLFKHPDCVDYHVSWAVLNSSDHNIPQNRERVFIIGCRDEADSLKFQWPKPQELKLKLKDILEDEVADKYYLSQDTINRYIEKTKENKKKGLGFEFSIKENDDLAFTLTCNNDKMEGNFISHSLFPRSSETEKGGTGPLNKNDGTTYCVDTGNTQAIEMIGDFRQDEGIRIRKNGLSPTVTTKAEVLLFDRLSDYQGDKVTQANKDTHPCLTANAGNKLRGVGIQEETRKIRKLTPLECLRLQGFPDTFYYNCVSAGLSESQIYKQAGNSITVNVMMEIFKGLSL